MGVAVRLYRSLLRTGRKIELKARSLPEHSPQRIKLVQARLHWLANLSITGASQHCADAQVTRAWFEDPARTDLDVGFAALRQMEQSLHRTDHALAWKKLLNPEPVGTSFNGLVLISAMNEIGSYEFMQNRIDDALDAVVKDSEYTFNLYKASLTDTNQLEHIVRSVNHSVFVALGLYPEVCESGCFVDAVLANGVKQCHPVVLASTYAEVCHRLGLIADVVRLPHSAPRDSLVLIQLNSSDPRRFLLSCSDGGEWVELEDADKHSQLIEKQHPMELWAMLIRDLIRFTNSSPSVQRMHEQHIWADTLEEIVTNMRINWKQSEHTGK